MNSGAGNIWSSLLEKRTILRWTVYFIFLPMISASHHKIQNDTFSQSYIYPIDHPWWSPVCINHPAFSPRLFQMTQYYEMKNLNLEHILVPIFSYRKHNKIHLIDQKFIGKVVGVVEKCMSNLKCLSLA